MKKLYIPFGKPDIRTEDYNRLKNSIRSGWLTHGPNSKILEKLFKKFTKSKYATTVSNCTSGLHLACLALGLKAGDEVIVPAQTHVATAHAAELTGAKVVFTDVDELTGNISLSQIKKKITNKTKCILTVHMSGFACSMNEIYKFCKKKKIFIIEDCAHGLGTKFNGIHVGNFGICGVFSFYPTKQITTGEGGVVISNNKKFIDKIKVIKAIGVDTPPEKRKIPGVYDVTNLGLNYRLTDFQSALAIGQLKRYNKSLLKRKLNAKEYLKLLSKNKNIKFQNFQNDHSYFIFQIFLKNKKTRDRLILELKKKGIGSSIHYAKCVPSMSYYKKKYKLKLNHFKNAKSYGDTSISLPVHQYISKKMIRNICSFINKKTI